MSINGSVSTVESQGTRPMASATEFLGRALLSSLFIVSGIEKMTTYADTGAYMAASGISAAWLPAVIALELGGGLAILIGCWTRSIAACLAVFTVLTALVFHMNFSDSNQATMFWKNMTISGGLTLLALYGPGTWSWDLRRA